MNKFIITTSGGKWTEQDDANLAWLVYLRFGEDLSAAHAAWSRLLNRPNVARGDEEDFLFLALAGAPTKPKCATCEGEGLIDVGSLYGLADCPDCRKVQP